MAATYFGFNPPFAGDSRGVMARQEDDRLIKNDIMVLLLTTPGERVMVPEFGVRIRSALFEKLDDTMVTDLQAEIGEKLARFEPRVVATDISVSKDDARHLLAVRIVAFLRIDPTRQITVERLFGPSV